MRLPVVFAAVLVSFATAACGDDSSEAPDAWNCSYEERAEPYTAGMNRTTANGVNVAIMDSTPAPPLRGDNAWNVRLTDDQQMPVEGMTITIFPWMPDHGHGTSSVPQIAETGNGDYTIDPVNMWMAGYWEVTVTIGDGIDPAEDVVFELCIDG